MNIFDTDPIAEFDKIMTDAGFRVKPFIKSKPVVEDWEDEFDEKFDYRKYNEDDSFFTILDKFDYNPASIEQIKDFIRKVISERY
jgi:hypothetical protein